MSLGRSGTLSALLAPAVGCQFPQTKRENIYTMSTISCPTVLLSSVDCLAKPAPSATNPLAWMNHSKFGSMRNTIVSA